MNLKAFDNIYFLGVGGIGMSALARYFNISGWKVFGYDKTPSVLTRDLENEGIVVHYEDTPDIFEQKGLDSKNTLIIYTPAIPQNLQEYVFVLNNGFSLLKRAEVLGAITRISKGLAVAGTHGKTTTSTMLAHILNQSNLGCTAFLGGISSNFNSNLLLNHDSAYTVIEADEFDRSFLQLDPFSAIITSCDPDHLDIYGDENQFREGFEQFTAKIDQDGVCVQKYGLNLPAKARVITYGVNEVLADAQATNLKFVKEAFFIDVLFEDVVYENVELGIPGVHNAENALACFVLAIQLGLNENVIREGLRTFKGVKRRFEYFIKSPQLVYVDDYAHHPTELKALIDSLKLLYPGRKITGVFQPHLFSRTRDFLTGFIEQLSRFDTSIVMPIYPARELPIPGVSSNMIVEQLTNQDKYLLGPQDVLQYLTDTDVDIVVTVGAGDIDRIVEPLASILREKLG